MKIDLNNIDVESFQLHEHIIPELLNEAVILIQPVHIGIKWNQANKHFRSSVWSKKDGTLISAGLPKFCNWGENPDNFPIPLSLDGCNVAEKMDGSALIVSKYNGHYILRTRGTVDASKLENGYEVEVFKKNILPKLCVEGEDQSWPISYVFEWITASPKQRVVINYNNSEPEFVLVGVVSHADYSLWSQDLLNAYAKNFKLKRPEMFSFSDVSSLLYAVETWKGKEGVCVYSNNDQTIHKVKSVEYLSKHRFKEHATLENTIDLFFSLGVCSYTEFEKKLTEVFDYECFEMVRGHASNICDAWKQVQVIVDGMKRFVTQIYTLPNRKEQALMIKSSYGTTNRASFVFSLLDGKNLDSEQLKKLMYQVLKK